MTPKRIVGDGRAEGVEFTVTGTDEVRRLPAGLVLTSIGYQAGRFVGCRSTNPLPWCRTTAAGSSERRVPMSPAGSNAAPPVSSGPTSRAPRRPCTTWWRTTTAACWRILSASRPHWTNSCAAGSPRWSTRRAGNHRCGGDRSRRRGPAARQVHRDHRHARRLGREADATDSPATARRPAALASSHAHHSLPSRCSQSLSPSRLLLQPIHSRVHRQSVNRRQPSVARRLVASGW